MQIDQKLSKIKGTIIRATAVQRTCSQLAIGLRLQIQVYSEQLGVFLGTIRRKIACIFDRPQGDIFVRWKPLEKQPINWDAGSNEYVRLKIRPFFTVSNVSKNGTGVLRDIPSFSWKMDRGKERKSAPWYHVLNSGRIDDHHLTLFVNIASQETAE